MKITFGRTVHGPQSLEFRLNIELEKVSHWLSANKLSLHIKKTSFVVFHCPQKKILHQVNLQISNKQLKQDNQVKYLGLILDSNLNWKSHIHELGKKISRGIGMTQLKFDTWSIVIYFLNCVIL